MFDDLETSASETEGQRSPDEESRPSPQLYRWAHFPAILTVGVLILLFHGNPWRWQIAVGGGYTVYVFFFAFGSVFSDADDFFGDPRAPRYALKLMAPHLLILAPLLAGVALWFHLKPMLPEWMTHEGRKGSIWDLFGWITLGLAGIAQGSWMARKIRRRFGPDEEQS
jgi:hypothetical protein